MVLQSISSFLVMLSLIKCRLSLVATLYYSSGCVRSKYHDQGDLYVFPCSLLYAPPAGFCSILWGSLHCLGFTFRCLGNQTMLHLLVSVVAFEVACTARALPFVVLATSRSLIRTSCKLHLQLTALCESAEVAGRIQSLAFMSLHMLQPDNCLWLKFKPYPCRKL